MMPTNCKKKCDICDKRFRCWTSSWMLHFLVRRSRVGVKIPYICHSVAGRYYYKDEEFEIAMQDCERLNKDYPSYAYTIETAPHVEYLGYDKA